MPSSKNNHLIYHIFIDRFSKESFIAKDECCCSLLNENDTGGFYGGTIAGVTKRLEDGWFCQLGVNMLLISAPYEQIRGWVPSAGKTFKHYGYHGYYALDYTTVDARFGTEQDLRDLVDKAHRKGIAVLMDIVMNHPGYLDLQTLHELDIKALHSDWLMASPDDYERFVDRESPALKDWWGSDWVRFALPGYLQGGNDDHTMLLHDLPDFRTESEQSVTLPWFLKNKVNTKAMDLPHTTVRGYLIHWLTDWIRDYGIDGFRCDSAKHVEPEAWLELKDKAIQAKQDWKNDHPDHPPCADGFWMMGEAFNHGIERDHYYDHGFDALINFDFQRDIKHLVSLDAIYESYAARVLEHPEALFVSYISSHDTHLHDRKTLKEGASALMLAPGGVLVLYGDETGRRPGPYMKEDPAQATRSPMNWDSVETDVLIHWRRLGQFRAQHAAIAHGAHLKLAECPYTFARLDAHGDRIVAALQANGEVSLPVGEVFGEGEYVHDAYSGWRGQVMHGSVRLDGKGVVLIEADAGPTEGRGRAGIGGCT